MAIGGSGKIGGAKHGRIKQGMQTDGGKFDERPLRDEAGGGGDRLSGGGGGSSSSGNDGRTYLVSLRSTSTYTHLFISPATRCARTGHEYGQGLVAGAARPVAAARVDGGL